MAHALSLVISSTTISLSTSTNTLTDYVPRTPTGDALTVTESATVWMTAASKSALQTAIRAVEDFFSLCRRRQATNTGDRGYVNLSVEGDGLTYRSEVLDGRIVLGEDALRHWGNLGAEVLISWTRRFYWEGALTALGLSNAGTAKTLLGVTITNHNDASTPAHYNYVNIDGADVLGSLPTPLKIMYVATAAIGTSRFYVSANVFGEPGSFKCPWEGEDSTGGGTPTADADCSGSTASFMRRTWTTAITHTDNAFVWSIATTYLRHGAGAWFRVLARLENTPPANCYAKLKIKFDGTTPLTTLYEGPEILLDTNRKLQDLGSIQLPPGYITGDPTALALILSLRHTGTSQLDLDFIQLCGPDGVHRFDQQGYQLAIGDIVTDDGPEGAVYIETTGGYTQHIFSDYGQPIYAWPGRDMRLRLLFDEGSGMVISRTMTATVNYRPRRVTV